PASRNNVTMMNVTVLTTAPVVAVKRTAGAVAGTGTMGAAALVGCFTGTSDDALLRMSSIWLNRRETGPSLCRIVAKVCGARANHSCAGVDMTKTSAAIKLSASSSITMALSARGMRRRLSDSTGPDSTSQNSNASTTGMNAVRATNSNAP